MRRSVNNYRIKNLKQIGGFNKLNKKQLGPAVQPYRLNQKSNELTRTTEKTKTVNQRKGVFSLGFGPFLTRFNVP